LITPATTADHKTDLSGEVDDLVGCRTAVRDRMKPKMNADFESGNLAASTSLTFGHSVDRSTAVGCSPCCSQFQITDRPANSTLDPI
jgi:hypothetical protein